MAMQDQSVSRIIRRDPYGDPVSQNNADVEFAHSAGKLGSNGLSARKLDSEIPTGENVGDSTFNLSKIVASHRLPASATAVVVPIATARAAAASASATKSTAAAAEATAWAAFARSHWASFVHDHGKAIVISAVELSDCVSRFFVSRELDETEAFGAAGFTVHDDLSGDYLANLREDLIQIVIGGCEWQFTNKKFLTHKSSFDVVSTMHV